MITVVTSFSKNGYAEYGRRFLSTFKKHWPSDIKLLIYHEGQDELGGYNLLKDVEPCVSFLERHKDNLVVHGKRPGPSHHWKRECLQNGYNFRFDAYKFARKIFAIEHAAGFAKIGKLFWVDADVVTFENIPVSFLDSVLPNNVCTSYLGRVKGYHSECGFVGYNLDHPQCHNLISIFAALYKNDTFMGLKEWHDSYVYDWVKGQMGVPAFNISPNESGHVFVTSSLGAYMDHLKGDRKLQGRSYPVNSKVLHKHPYWRRTV